MGGVLEGQAGLFLDELFAAPSDHSEVSTSRSSGLPSQFNPFLELECDGARIRVGAGKPA